uniref:Uncharacterized protein LOC105059422 isoform X1 n=1 Tax=Elaeis guineensis var. tenera TaxID=51953 RepID=A0A8N4I9S2_ELAGV|nr:uncharacterized protein LOC105059422 isoform X1 [Elaeis guineensis]
MEAQAEADKAKAVAEAKLKAVEEYKASAEFEAKVTEGSSVVFGYGFDACKAQVAHFFPEMDVSRLNPYEVVGEEVEQQAGGSVEPTVEPVVVEPFPTIELVSDESTDTKGPAIESIAVEVQMDPEPIIDVESLSDEF